MTGNVHESAFVHPLACVDGFSRIGARSRVWQFASVVRGCDIGEDVSIAHGACVDGSIVGDGSIIGHNVAMGPGFKVGRGCFVGPQVTLCNDAWPRATKEGFDLSRFDGEHFAVILEDGASVGANAVIMPGVRIGAGAMVAAGATVVRDVPAAHLWITSRDVRRITRDMVRERMRFASAANLFAGPGS